MRAGIVSHWFERGGAYLALAAREALEKAGHRTYVLAKHDPKNKPLGAEWQVERLTWVGAGTYANPLPWAMRNELDLVLFCGGANCAKVQPLRDAGIKLVLIRMWEFLNPANVGAINETFDWVLALTKCSYRRFREIGLERVAYVPWGTDLDLFKLEPREANLSFFHPGGWGGVGNRRQTRLVRQAFAQADTGTANLFITRQSSIEPTGKVKRQWLADMYDGKTQSHVSVMYGTVKRQWLADMYNAVHVAILPSKWEGLGLTFIESLAAGLAIVTVDAPPMNEYVTHLENGYLCRARMHEPLHSKGIQINQALVTVADLAFGIEWLCQKSSHSIQAMGQRSRRRAEREFDWDVNGAGLVTALEGI